MNSNYFLTPINNVKKQKEDYDRGNLYFTSLLVAAINMSAEDMRVAYLSQTKWILDSEFWLTIGLYKPFFPEHSVWSSSLHPDSGHLIFKLHDNDGEYDSIPNHLFEWILYLVGKKLNMTPDDIKTTHDDIVKKWRESNSCVTSY